MTWTAWLLVLVPVAISAGQLLFKAASQTTASISVASLGSLLFNPWFLAAILLYGAATLSWIFVLQNVSVSRAYQFMALSFVAVPLGAWFVFGEALNARQLLGTAVIVGGIIIGNS